MDIYCYGDFGKYHPLLHTYFTESAFDAVEEICNVCSFALIVYILRHIPNVT